MTLQGLPRDIFLQGPQTGSHHKTLNVSSQSPQSDITRSSYSDITRSSNKVTLHVAGNLMLLDLIVVRVHCIVCIYCV